ncbi:hypothetical protein Taro_041845 [Colocasia esculenta]|uniref:Uncharacterized protein n=1 Tax=Colocasia esculenta TaxID=4460 RepID=A0A843WR28_COLES|nr:hypothetical protein [Colocasia esculenta]
MSEIREALGHGDPLFHTMSEKLQLYGEEGVGIQIDEPSSIYRVPSSTWKVDPGAYEPQVVSIGPYHRQNPKLHAMEDHKWRYMRNLLRRRTQSNFNLVLKLCIEKVKQSEARARSCYKVPFYISNYDFVMMLVLDGCFILELFHTCFYGAMEDDLIYAIPWMFPAIWRDLLKLENQIPFFILLDLFTVNIVTTELTNLSLKELAFSFLEAGPLKIVDPFEEEEACNLNPVGEEKIYHLLHFYHILLQPTVDAWTGKPSTCSSMKSVIFEKMNNWMPHILRKPSLPKVVRGPDNMIPCIVELREAGIKFRRKQGAKTVLNVAFRDGVLHIPCLSVEDNTNSVFRNLLAFEQFCPNNWHYITTYTTFLDCIVNTAKDVTILQQYNVIENMLGSEEELALLINQLGKDVTVCPRCHYLKRVFREVNEYCESKWHKHRASCMRDYFGTPWSMLSVFAAVALLLMTLIQVIVAILSYQKQ